MENDLLFKGKAAAGQHDLHIKRTGKPDQRTGMRQNAAGNVAEMAAPEKRHETDTRDGEVFKDEKICHASAYAGCV